MSNKQENTKELLIKAKLYKGVSLVFVVLGLIVFLILYVSKIEGRIVEALSDPSTLVIFTFPFIPAAFLSWIGSLNEKKYLKLTGGK